MLELTEVTTSRIATLLSKNDVISIWPEDIEHLLKASRKVDSYMCF